MGIVHQRSPLRVPQRPRHPEVHEQSPPRIEPNNQILATAPDLADTLADELAGDEHRVERPHQAWIADLDVLEACPLEDGRDRPAHGLDLGQLRHEPSLGGDAFGADAAQRLDAAQPITSSRMPRWAGASSPIV